MPQTKHETSPVKSAYGQPVDLKAEFDYTEYAVNEFDSMVEAVGKETIVDAVNARSKSNARSAAIAAITAPYKPDPNSPAEIRKRMIADAMKGNSKLTEETAGALVDSLLSA